STLISKEEISDYFYSLDKNIAIPNRMELVSRWILQELRIHQQKEKSKDWVLEEVELLDKEDFLQAYYKNQLVDEDDFSLEEDILREEVVKRQFAPIRKQVKRYAFVHTLATYRQMFVSWKPHILVDEWETIRGLSVSNLDKRFLTWEDAAPYRYFRDKMIGDKSQRAIRHLFIDEAQDYSAFQFAFIKELFPYTRFTLLGDINQAIYTYASTDNPLVPESINEKHERILLTKSYRSTKQIVEFTKKFAPGGEIIEPFEREGDVPSVLQLSNKEDLADTIIQFITDLKTKTMKRLQLYVKHWKRVTKSSHY
ncbi:UvrD-helicase domain-containing protein, partial [Ornithinibacillus scapharcae]|uniref:UvrD-helicase domain-containing protein n=1 Tax=Ornithinibacillus scapharcae TaxID=1147159 RepID=UPI000225AFDE